MTDWKMPEWMKPIWELFYEDNYYIIDIAESHYNMVLNNTTPKEYDREDIVRSYIQINQLTKLHKNRLLRTPGTIEVEVGKLYEQLHKITNVCQNGIVLDELAQVEIRVLWEIKDGNYSPGDEK